MKNYFVILFIAFSYCLAFTQDGHDVNGTNMHKQEITKQDYLDALSLFDSDELQPEEDLEKSMGIAQMYLMRKQDYEGLINLYEKAAQYAKKTDQIQKYIDLKSNKAQMLITSTRPKEAIEIMDDLIANYDIPLELMGRFHKAKGDALGDLGNLKEAEKNYLKGTEIARELKDTFNIGVAYTSMAAMHSKLGNVYDAIDYNIKALNILKEGDHAYLISGACHVLCNIFQDLGNYDKAHDYAEKMDQLCTMKGYKQLGAYANSILGQQYVQKNEYDKALKHYQLALDEFNRKAIRVHTSNHEAQVFALKTDMATALFKKGNFQKSKALLEEMEKIDMGTFDTKTKMNFYQALIESAIEEKNNSKIRSYLSKTKNLIQDGSSFKIKKTYAWLQKTSAEYFRNYKETNTHLNTFFALKDSIEKEQRSQLVHNLEAKYQKAEQEKEITFLNFENDKAESKIKQKNIVLALGAIGLGILSILVFQLYKLYQSNKKNKEQLASQNIIITKALEDKNTLLKEIHHRVKNNLQVISSLLSLQSRYIKDEETLDAIKAGKSRVQSMSLLHQNLYRDDNLKGVEMNQYFQNLGQNLFDTYNIEDNIKFTTDIDDITLDIDTVVPMGLITNELVSNALKHAFVGRESGTIHLSLKEKNDTLYLTVKDNGVGLPDGELPVSHKSLGATLIQSFTEKLEGEIKIDISEGSSVTVEIKDYTLV